jgi:UDP-glucose 4-epimerase
MDRIGAGEPPLIFGDGLQTRDWVYVEDVARANIAAAKSAVNDEVFNVASGKETSLRELAALLMKAMGRELRIEYKPERAVNPVPRRWASARKTQEQLGFEAKVPLEEGLRRLVAWWRETRGA